MLGELPIAAATQLSKLIILYEYFIVHKQDSVKIILWRKVTF